jgi:hypothetical protein
LLGVAGLLSLASFGACELTKIDLPVKPSAVVIHGVLTVATSTQTVLVERTLTGVRQSHLVYGPIDASDPIVTDGGIPEEGAVVDLTGPDGQTIRARELQTFHPLGHGAGVYVFSLAGAALVPGGRYQLRVLTKEQELVTAETTVPVAALAPTGPTIDFNRAEDTLALSWPKATSAAGFEVRIESPHAPWIAFTDSTHLALTGTLRSLAAENLPNVFVPGFRQGVSISAVDANLYDYYRTSNNDFTGTGLISRVSGGYGVFGSLVTVARRTLNVTATAHAPIEGTYVLLPNSLGYPYGGFGDAVGLTLYVESPSAKADQPDAISAAYRRSGGSVDAAVGTLSGNLLKLAFLQAQSLEDTVDHFVGVLKGDTLDGQFSKGAPGRYVRVP